MKKYIKKSKYRKRKILEETKLLVLHFKPFFKKILNEVESNPKKVFRRNLETLLQEKSGLFVFQQCLKFTRFREALQKKVENGQMLKDLLQRRREHNNHAKVLRYLNRMINAIYNPSIFSKGLWTRKAVIIKEDTKLQVKIEQPQNNQT